MKLHRRIQTEDLPSWCTRPFLQRLLRREGNWLSVAVALAERNVSNRSGGPFGALVVDDAANEVLGVGVNRVETLANPVLHAEVLAITSASLTLCTYAIGEATPKATLYTSSEPCVMCLGAIHWAGVRRVVFAAPVDAAERIGFDEGPCQRELRAGLEGRGVSFRRGAGARRVARLLAEYVRLGREIYNVPDGEE